MLRLRASNIVLLALLPITLSVISFYCAHIFLSAPERVDWVSIGAPPSGAVAFEDQKGVVRASDGKLYWLSGDEWTLKSDQVLVALQEYDDSCPPVIPPAHTVDLFQNCRWVSDEYYAILEDGTVWFYATGGDGHFRISRNVGEFIVKVLASVVGLAFGVGILAIIGMIGIDIKSE